MKFIYNYDNKRLILIGTAHVSPESVKEVESLIDNNVSDVCIELDRQRYNSVKNQLLEKEKVQDVNNKKSNKNKKKKSRKRTGINKEYGLAGNLFLIIGSFVQKKMGAMFNLEPGAEFSKAIEVTKSKHINLFLIDQKIHTTLSDFKRIPKREQWKLLKSIIWPFGLDKSNLKNIDRRSIDLKNMVFEYDTILNITKFMQKNYPTLYEVLVEKRNRIMSKNVLKIVREKAEKDVVVIVGAGHLPGMLKIIDKNEDFRRII